MLGWIIGGLLAMVLVLLFLVRRAGLAEKRMRVQRDVGRVKNKFDGMIDDLNDKQEDRKAKLFQERESKKKELEWQIASIRTAEKEGLTALASKVNELFGVKE